VFCGNILFMNPSDIEREIQNLKERNIRVDMDKAWERSWTRRLSIMILTYIVACIWLFVIKETHIFLKAVVPVLGYLLSTLTIPQIKKIWITGKKD
jgi:hypothetical protein